MAWAGWDIGWLVLPGGGPALAVLLTLWLAGEKGNPIETLAAAMLWSTGSRWYAAALLLPAALFLTAHFVSYFML